MTPRTAPRLAAALAAALALSACATQEAPQSATQRAAQAPASDAVKLHVVDVEPGKRIELAREGQLQTPLRMPPEATGAPRPREHNGEGMVLDTQRLAEAGVDISPNVRVWEEQGGRADLEYGPRPRSAADLALSPGVYVGRY